MRIGRNTSVCRLRCEQAIKFANDFGKTEATVGGFGSGRHSKFGRATVESCRSIDVNRLNRTGCLAAGWSGGWQWTVDGEKVASINLSTLDDCLQLTYRVRVAGGDWEDVTETARVVRVSCRFGGSRPYFICPGVVNGVLCFRRVAKLHASGIYFLCRHCYRLSYASQSDDRLGRANRRRNTLRARLAAKSGERNDQSFIARRPKGMWHRKYEQLCNQIIDAEEVADAIFEKEAGRLLSRFGD